MKKYLINEGTMQIHRNPPQPLCHITAESNVKKCSAFKSWWLRTFKGYDGCGICMPKQSKINN